MHFLRSSLIPIDSTDSQHTLLILFFGSLLYSSSHIFFKIFKAYLRPGRKSKICSRPSNIVCLLNVHGIFLSGGETIGEFKLDPL
jgi:hypothetical protein